MFPYFIRQNMQVIETIKMNMQMRVTNKSLQKLLND